MNSKPSALMSFTVPFAMILLLRDYRAAIVNGALCPTGSYSVRMRMLEA
jgi:hypothetical protein